MAITIGEMNNTTRKTNKERIIDYLNENPSRITTTDLAKKTGIDIKNISRYLKQLESEKKIIRETVQDGRIRVVYISLTTYKENTTTRNHAKKIIDPQDPQEKFIDQRPLSQNSVNKNINFVKQLGEEMRQFNRTIPIDMKQELVNWLFKNLAQLYEGIYYYLNAWEKRYNKRLRGAPSSPVIPKYEKMLKTFAKIQELIQFKQNLENMKKKKQNQLEEVLKNTKIRR